MKMKNVMTKAWEIAREGAAKFGGKASEYFAKALKMAWAIIKKGVDMMDHKEKFIELVKEFIALSNETRKYDLNVRHLKLQDYIDVFDEDRKEFMVDAMTEQVQKAKDYLQHKMDTVVRTNDFETVQSGIKNFKKKDDEGYFLLREGIYKVDGGRYIQVSKNNNEYRFVSEETVTRWNMAF